MRVEDAEGGAGSGVGQHAGSNVIVYSPTIKRVEETVAYLAAQGISAIGYHGKMDSVTCWRNQERMSDEVPVLVGTVAFGLGINKAAVRAVIHLSLPKWTLSSITRRLDARGVTDFRPIVCCCGRRETRACLRILLSSSAIRRNTKGLAAISYHSRFCQLHALPASSDLFAFW